jgi:hypothetical protein
MNLASELAVVADVRVAPRREEPHSDAGCRPGWHAVTVALPSDHPGTKSSCGCHGFVRVLPKARRRRVRYCSASVLHPEAFVELARAGIPPQCLLSGPLDGCADRLVDRRRELAGQPEIRLPPSTGGGGSGTTSTFHLSGFLADFCEGI